MTLQAQLTEKSGELLPYFKPQFLQREHTVFRFVFDNDEPFHLVVDGDGFSFTPGNPANATITLYVDCHETCWNLLSGASDSMAAFMAGKYRADGNIVLSQLLLYLFRNEDLVKGYEVKE